MQSLYILLRWAFTVRSIHVAEISSFSVLCSLLLVQYPSLPILLKTAIWIVCSFGCMNTAPVYILSHVFL